MLLGFAIAALLLQTPQPFPKPGAAKPAAPPAAPAEREQTVLPPVQPAPGPNDVPTEATLGVPIYPGAQFITSYDATGGSATTSSARIQGSRRSSPTTGAP